jgi:hypothetical protein
MIRCGSEEPKTQVAAKFQLARLTDPLVSGNAVIKMKLFIRNMNEVPKRLQ